MVSFGSSTDISYSHQARVQIFLEPEYPTSGVHIITIFTLANFDPDWITNYISIPQATDS